MCIQMFTSSEVSVLLFIVCKTTPPYRISIALMAFRAFNSSSSSIPSSWLSSELCSDKFSTAVFATMTSWHGEGEGTEEGKEKGRGEGEGTEEGREKREDT